MSLSACLHESCDRPARSPFYRYCEDHLCGCHECTWRGSDVGCAAHHYIHLMRPLAQLMYPHVFCDNCGGPCGPAYFPGAIGTAYLNGKTYCPKCYTIRVV